MAAQKTASAMSLLECKMNSRLSRGARPSCADRSVAPVLRCSWACTHAGNALVIDGVMIRHGLAKTQHEQPLEQGSQALPSVPCTFAACLQAHENSSTRATSLSAQEGLLLLCCCPHEPAGMQQPYMACMVLWSDMGVLKCNMSSCLTNGARCSCAGGSRSIRSAGRQVCMRETTRASLVS